MPTVSPEDLRGWQRAAWAGMALALLAFWLQSQIPQNVCSGDPTRTALIVFQLARTPEDIAALFGTMFGGPCTAGMQVGFAYANRLDLLLFIPLYGFFLGQLAWLLGARGTHKSGALLIGFCATAIVADIGETLLQLYIGAHLPGTPLTTLMLALMGHAKYLGLAAYAGTCAHELMVHRPVAAPRWLALWLAASALATLFALLNLLPQDWLIACVGLGWVALLGLALAQGFDKDLHKAS